MFTNTYKYEKVILVVNLRSPSLSLDSVEERGLISVSIIQGLCKLTVQNQKLINITKLKYLRVIIRRAMWVNLAIIPSKIRFILLKDTSHNLTI